MGVERRRGGSREEEGWEERRRGGSREEEGWE